jgi:hypothetical protein
MERAAPRRLRQNKVWRFLAIGVSWPDDGDEVGCWKALDLAGKLWISGGALDTATARGNSPLYLIINNTNIPGLAATFRIQQTWLQHHHSRQHGGKTDAMTQIGNYVLIGQKNRTMPDIR